MGDNVRTFPLGAATVTRINVRDLHVRLADWIDLPEDARTPENVAAFAQPLRLPVWVTHIGLPGISVLVDAGDAAAPGNPPETAPDYEPPPGLGAGLAAAGIPPEEVTHVVITHGHGDHYDGTTHESQGAYRPRFPQARHYLGRAEWEAASFQQSLGDPNSVASRTLGVLRHQGLLDLVEGDRDLGHGVRILAAPGETRGHQIVRIHSEGRTLYCVGDLYHDPVEIAHPDWMVRWADPGSTLASRRRFVETALSEEAVLIATHVLALGRLAGTGTDVTLVEV